MRKSTRETRETRSSGFNDGEVVIQQGGSSSNRNINQNINQNMSQNVSLCEEQENTEEITVKVSPVKHRDTDRATAGFKRLGKSGLGKCSRVIMKSGTGTGGACGGNDDNSDSDEENGTDCDVSTFVRPSRRAAPIPAVRTTRSTISTAAYSATLESKVQGPSESSLIKANQIKESNKENIKESKSKTFVMDSEMKNFDPVEWRKVRVSQKPSHDNQSHGNNSPCHSSHNDHGHSSQNNIYSQPAGKGVVKGSVKVIDEEVVLSLPSLPVLSVQPALSVLPSLSAALSPIMSGGEQSMGSDDESDEMETMPLDLSVCLTQLLIPQCKKTSNEKAKARTIVGGNEKFSQRGGVKGGSAKEQRELPVVTFKSSSSNVSAVIDQSTTAADDDEAVSPEASGKDSKRKRVSFAGNPGPDKRNKETHKENAVSRPSRGSKESVQENEREKGKGNETQERIVTLTLKDKTYTRLNVLGKGGSSCVYRVMSQEDSNLYAYKRVEVKGSTEDNEALFDSYINEIDLLRRLKGTSPYIIDLVDAEVDREGMYIAIVMEAGEVDLAKVLSQKQKQAALPSSVPHMAHNMACNSSSSGNGGNGGQGGQGYASSLSSSSSSYAQERGGVERGGGGSGGGDSGMGQDKELLNPFFTRMVWQEMLEAVNHIHSHRIVHGDLKPANFVFVKGHLKLIDFGIAKAFSNDTTNIYRESQIGTVNYMAPEAIAPYTIESDDNEHEGMSMRLGRASDIWSLGCILYQMLYGRPPFAALTTIQKLHAIPNPKYAIQYPEGVDEDAVQTIRACLERDPRKRAVIRGQGGLLSMPYLSVRAMRGGDSNDQMRGGRVSACNGVDSADEEVDGRGRVSVSKDQVRSAVQLAVKSLQGQQGENQLFNELWRALSDGQGRAESTAISGKSAPSSATPLRNVPDSDTHNTPLTPRMNFTSERNCGRNMERNNERNTETSSKGRSNPEVQQVTAVTSGTPVATVAHVRHTVNSSSRSDASTASIPPHIPHVPLDKNPNIPPRSMPFIPTDNKENNPTHTAHTVHTPSTPSTPSTPTPAVIVPSAATRLALVNFAAEAARKRSATAAAAAAVSNQTTTMSATPATPTSSSSSCISSSSSGRLINGNSSSRAPLRALPPSLQEQILKGQRALENASQGGSGHSSRDKWVRPKGLSPEKQDLKSVIEKRIGAMRKFLDEEQDLNVTGTVDFGDGNSFF